jgi:flavin reductase (DIM6/NTAB) family NADH-FMN oxidoreductase RutF/DNA-binding GntR family transcriptional regulator
VLVPGSGPSVGSGLAAGVDPRSFRDVVGHLTSGVTVVTTRTAHAQHGLTASSVTSLSVEPPMMLACVNNAAPTSAAIAEAGCYAVNILGQDQAHVAQQFAAPSDDKFQAIAVTDGVLGAPLLADALAHIECKVVERVTGGTHTIFLGEVVHASAQAGHPLTYFRGDFGRFEFARDDAAYEEARMRVLNRAYSAGTVLTLSQLAADLGADESAAFYALTRMSTDGLVQRDPGRGYVIVPFDESVSDEAFDARCAIELGVISTAMEHVTDAEVQGLRERFEVMATLLVDGMFVDFDGYLEANYRFHEAVVALGHNQALLASFGRLGIKGVMTRSFGSTRQSSQRFVDIQRRMVEAFEARDAAAARAATIDYSESAKERVREILAGTGGHL